MKLGRRLTNQMITNFLPALIICIICYFTNYFKVGRINYRINWILLILLSLQPTYFEAAIGVNATSLVTLTTLFTSVADSLPRTAYLKLIDIWQDTLNLGNSRKDHDNLLFSILQVHIESLHSNVGGIAAYRH